ncbi:protoporphyrinogen oxidase [Tuwongella immobilis]|uniref:Coproporphyrinogen III oxidase n=1 Tax=Tuwongella immobilis TaxID=692036 RepID=A0A6C2YXR1_9BACT|nr:protoporphyrinogen oxidase [Tuwongella immobilis]VIP05649.1 protoporphyrinogen oxidase : Protoporphyrinogen oxidase OS=Geobacter lovleyi (strain ATCC BAA-1151 / DSM 17278 / SZ) GN=Glov_0521 PE=4 SV=1: Amino_oxidase [Tuwongella immobilis]VTS08654.1 protoporphyrinogen oxidase : Protoporphyrinogen oxidase OS=Geobacter lovleyi (strain ATCC BAA-1151 / DSM 17278 / SZ) GN=Glov_0521 PE=4 SV=1: Amino_oxidase [Tuwongella immobilis]
MARIVILGAGLSGLALAYRLQQRLPHAAITLIEPRNRPGGNIWTARQNGFQIEEGPNGFLDSKPSTMQLCRDLGLGDQLLAASEGSRKNRYVYLRDQLQKLPGGLMPFLRSPLMSWRGKLAFALEQFRKPPSPIPEDESIAAFATRRAGRESAEIFADALVTGIHGGDPELLSIRSCFPRLAQFEREFGSVIKGVFAAAKVRRKAAQARGETPQPQRMWSFRPGLRLLVETLHEQFRGTYVGGIGVRRIRRADPATSDGARWLIDGEGGEQWQADVVIPTCPAYISARLLADVDEPLAHELDSIAYTRIAVVALAYRRADVPRADLDGFGYIAPQRTRRDVLGVQWCSSIFPDRAPDGLVMWRALCGGWHRGEMLDWSNEQLLRAVHAEMTVAMGVTGEPVHHHIVRWPKAIPQYFIGHHQRVQRVEMRLVQLPGLFLGGNILYGVAMNDCTEQAELLAHRIADSLTPSAG